MHAMDDVHENESNATYSDSLNFQARGRQNEWYHRIHNKQ